MYSYHLDPIALEREVDPGWRQEDYPLDTTRAAVPTPAPAIHPCMVVFCMDSGTERTEIPLRDGSFQMVCTPHREAILDILRTQKRSEAA